MATDTQDNSGLYFIVGGLVVAFVVAFVYFNNNNIGVISPQNPTVIERTTTNTIEKAPPAPQSNSLELNVDRNGASATSTQDNE